MGHDFDVTLWLRFDMTNMCIGMHDKHTREANICNIILILIISNIRMIIIIHVA